MSEQRQKELLKAGQKHQYAITLLVLMTCINIALGVMMVSRMVSIPVGMLLSFTMMSVIILHAHRRLLDPGETVWESPEEFHKRRNR